ncbi:hypothetical protein EVAR_23283_1 [Eumeta japonica]|uniref:Uncharacterized protein n=1 Tax=Eumeta variegata TaxID=151549 RepID=A0A4C1V6B7_EUMVA|nr:hypothetical protein EVAR_23283_1 [Eumeta japonica]
MLRRRARRSNAVSGRAELPTFSRDFNSADFLIYDPSDSLEQRLASLAGGSGSVDYCASHTCTGGILSLNKDSARAGDALRDLVVEIGMSVKNVSKASATSISFFRILSFIPVAHTIAQHGPQPNTLIVRIDQLSLPALIRRTGMKCNSPPRQV